MLQEPFPKEASTKDVPLAAINLDLSNCPTKAVTLSG